MRAVAGSEQNAGNNLGVGEGDAVDAETEWLGGVERIVRRRFGDFEQAVHFTNVAATERDEDFLPHEWQTPCGADFLDDAFLA